MIALSISSRTRRTMRVGLGPTKEDNAVMAEIGKRGTVNSSDRRCILSEEGSAVSFALLGLGYGFVLGRASFLVVVLSDRRSNSCGASNL
jgi:hypothetical protein